MKKYGITTIAKLFGITTEAIRKYEAKGIIGSHRNCKNRYREYETWDIPTLFRARMYRKSGFSLSQTSDMINSMSIDEIISSMNDREEELIQEIIERQKFMLMLREWKNNLSELNKYSNGKFVIEYSPEIYFCDFLQSDSITEDADIIALAGKWIEHLPFVSLGIRADAASVLYGNPIFTAGICTTKEDKAKLNLPDLPYTHKAESRLCISTILMGTYNNPLNTDSFTYAREYIKEHNMQVSGEVIGKTILTNKHDADYCYYQKIWMPIDIET